MFEVFHQCSLRQYSTPSLPYTDISFVEIYSCYSSHTTTPGFVFSKLWPHVVMTMLHKTLFSFPRIMIVTDSLTMLSTNNSFDYQCWHLQLATHCPFRDVSLTLLSLKADAAFTRPRKSPWFLSIFVWHTLTILFIDAVTPLYMQLLLGVIFSVCAIPAYVWAHS